jgi:chorismate lyase/3-hydroxybenzoate synthase
MHPHHIGRQLRETLRNLEALTTQNSIAPFAAKGKSLLLKVYLRHPDRIGEIAIPLRAWAGSDARIIYLKGDICRRELEIEIEAHCIGPHTCN